LTTLEPWTHASLEASLTALLAERGEGLGALAQPLRVAVCGQAQGPGIFETLAALGRPATLARVRRALAVARLDTPAGAL
jgi:glutamyl-tRNA synthetase